MKKALNLLKSNEGFVFIVLILIVVVLGTLGIALAAGTVVNVKTHRNLQNVEHEFYDIDGAMTYVQAVLEKACTYGRHNAQDAVDQAYEEGIANELPLTNSELSVIFMNTFTDYILNGRGRYYIEEELDAMADSPVFAVNTTAYWSDATFDDEGITLSVDTKKIGRSEKLRATFLLPYYYVQDDEREITIIRNNPNGEGTMPVGFYNPVFRSGLTIGSKLSLNGGATLYIDALTKKTTGIGMQWPNGQSSGLMYMDARVDIYGTTVPILERDGSNTLAGNSTELYVNGFKVMRSTPCETTNRIDLADYYDSSKMSLITPNDNDSGNSYYEAVDGDLVIRIYKGNASILSSDSGSKWQWLSGKRGLVIIEGTLSSNGGFNINPAFSGAIVSLGTGNSLMNSSLKIMHDEDAITDALDLFKEATNGSTALEQMFKLETLSKAKYDPESITTSTDIAGGNLFQSPLILGHNYMTSGGLVSNVTYPYFRIADKEFELDNTAKGLMSSKDYITLYTQNNIKFIVNGNNIWNKNDNGNRSVNTVGDIFDLVDGNLLRSWGSGGIISISRQEATPYLQILKIFTGNVTINNQGKIGNENVNGGSGLIFVNGRLTIDGPLNFTGAIIATNGINAYNSGLVKINFNAERALDAVNLSESAKRLFAPSSNIQQMITSPYDDVDPAAELTEDDLTLFSSPITISNIKYEPPYTAASVYGATSDITLNNSGLMISYVNGIGMQSTTKRMFLHSDKNNPAKSLKINKNGTIRSINPGEFDSEHIIGPLKDYLNEQKLIEWISSSTEPIKIISGDLVLALLSEGQSYDLSQFDGKRGFVFCNGQLEINGKFDFQGVVVASRGIKFNKSNNNQINVTFNQEAAVDAVALSSIASEIFLNVSPPSVSSGTYTGASTSGGVVVVDKGVKILSWNTVK